MCPESFREGVEGEAAVVQALPGAANGVWTVEVTHVAIVPVADGEVVQEAGVGES
jgi:hypothetical protein